MGLTLLLIVVPKTPTIFFSFSALFDPLERMAHISLNSARIEAGDGAFSCVDSYAIIYRNGQRKIENFRSSSVWGHQYLETDLETSNLVRTA
jgi:hypothetical protein